MINVPHNVPHNVTPYAFPLAQYGLWKFNPSSAGKKVASPTWAQVVDMHQGKI